MYITVKKIIVFFLLPFCCFACTKVDELSDEAGIVSYRIVASTEGVELGEAWVDAKNNTVFVPLEYGRQFFPLEISAEVVLSSTTKEVVSTNSTPVNLKHVVFKDVYTPLYFYLVADSGVPHLWKVELQDKANAEILSLVAPGVPAANVTIWRNNVRINLPGTPEWPVTLVPTITTTENARFKDYREGDALVFSSYNDVKHLTLVAGNGDERTWNVQITPSIENSSFELWTGVGTNKVNINPMPGVGRGWATANNTYVQGTMPMERDGGYAARLQTSVQDLRFLGLGELIASGSIFTGYFKLSLQLDNPRSMTNFGIPFTTRPVSVSLDARYEAGKVLQRSVKGKKGYELVRQEGSDKGHVWVELLRWTGSGELAYHGEGEMPGLTVLGRGDYVFEADAPGVSEWSRRLVPIVYNAAYASLEPTHIAIVMTSSKDGDLFLGAVGSVLEADNVVINY